MPPAPIQEIEEPSPSLRVQESADKLERHIRACGLKPGDRYITTEEAGRLLGKSAVMAQRAMALLAKKNILERRPKAGTFIGKAAARDLELSCIHFLVPENFMVENNPSATYWGQIQGIRSVIPNLAVQFNFIPNQDLEYTRQLIEKASAKDSLTGVVLMLSSRAMRSYFNESGIPTVVEGGIEPDLGNLCWLDWDQAQIGRLMATHLLSRGHRRMVTIMRDIWSMGEPLLHDGIGEALEASELPSSSLRIRSVPTERSAIAELTRNLLLHDPAPPTAFICRNEFQADCVSETAFSLGVGEKVEVVMCHAPAKLEKVKYTCVVPEIDTFEQGRIVGTMLQSLIKRTPPVPRGHSITVRLRPFLPG